MGPLSSEVTEAFCRVPSTSFSQAPNYTLIIHLCRFRVRSMMRLFPGIFSQQVQSIKNLQFTKSVTLIWSRNINLVPIDYDFRPRLRSRLNLRGLALRRNPWTFGDSVFRTVLATHVSIFTSDTSRHPREHPSQAYGMLRYRARIPKKSRTRSFGVWLKPRYIVGAGWLT